MIAIGILVGGFVLIALDYLLWGWISGRDRPPWNLDRRP